MADTTTTPGAMPAASCEPFADTHFDATPPEGVAIPFTRDEVSELVQALQRRALAGELPTAKPPASYAPLRDVAGPAGKRAQVVAYFIREGLQWDHIGPDGEIRTPRDPGYLAALQARLTRSAPPKGWKLRRRRVRWLCALVSGNALMMEMQARAMGYTAALHDHRNVVRLVKLSGEVLSYTVYKGRPEARTVHGGPFLSLSEAKAFTSRSGGWVCRDEDGAILGLDGITWHMPHLGA
jgi:hypothetical protein